MKKMFKIFLIILIPAILITLFFILHIFFYDPFIKLAPKNTFFYTYINLSKTNIFTKEFDSLISERKDIKNYIENNISKDNLYKVNNYYNNKAAIFLSNENNNINIFLVFKKQNNKLLNDNIKLEINDFENIVNKYLDSDNKIKLQGEFFGDYFFITNNLNSLKNAESEKYIFYKNYLYLIFKNKEFNNLLSKNLINGYINLEPIKNILENNNINIFNKNYSLFSVSYINKKVEIKINNVNNLKSEMNDFNIYNLFNPNIVVDNFNLNNFYNQASLVLNNNEDTKKEMMFFNKFLNYENINIDDFKKIFDNKSRIFLTFNHNLNLNNINNFLIITKLNNIEDYSNEINNLQNIFLREAGKNNLKSKTEKINNIILNEKVISTDNLSFNDTNIYNNNIKQDIKFLKLKNYTIYFSFIKEGNYFIISNSLKMINDLYYNEKNKYILEVNNLNNSILFENKNGNLIMSF